jgi:hypothetical protein
MMDNENGLAPVWYMTFLFWPRRDFATNLALRGPAMTRKLNGRRQYRAMTAAELCEFLSRDAW